MRCCFCRRVIKDYGHNPAPFSLSMSPKDGSLRCCRTCNDKYILPARLYCRAIGLDGYYDIKGFYEAVEVPEPFLDLRSVKGFRTKEDYENEL